MSSNNHIKIYRIIRSVTASVLIIGLAISVTAQPKPRPVKKQAGQNKPFRFGNILISNYDTLSGAFGVKVEANGPNTTIDVLDPKDPSAKTQLKARDFVATMSSLPDPKDKTKQGAQQVEKVVATGNLHYTSSRSSKEGVVQKMRGTASKGTYYNLESRIELAGPIDFDAQVTDKSGAILQTAKGASDSATYDEDKQILRMKRVSTVTVMVPSLKEPAVLTDASEITLELGETPPKFHIGGGTLKATPSEPPAKKKP